MCIIDCPTTTIHGHRHEALVPVLSGEGSWVEAQMMIHASFVPSNHDHACHPLVSTLRTRSLEPGATMAFEHIEVG